MCITPGYCWSFNFHPTRLRLIVKIFELVFPLEVTPLPSPALRLVFRSLLTAYSAVTMDGKG